MPRSSLWPLLLVFAVLSACASVEAGSRAPGVVPSPDSEEAGLWMVTERREQAIRQSPRRIGDPALEAYVRDVMCRVAERYCADIRIYLLEQPWFNALMAPNGYGEVWSGLLLRVQSEDELAFVLGHEAAHFTENHTLERWRLTKRNANIALAASAAVALAGVPQVGGVAESAALASIYGFSRENEHEADRLGLARQERAGYDPRAGAELWARLEEENQASSISAVRERGARASLYATHPLTRERIAALEAGAHAPGPAARGSPDRHEAMIASHLDAWLEAEVRRGDPGQSLYLLDRLAARGHRLGLIAFHRGEVYRARREEGDEDRALAAYRTALDEEGAPARTWRSLGLVLRARGEQEAAHEAFAAYLQAAPHAPDRALIEHYLHGEEAGS